MPYGPRQTFGDGIVGGISSVVATIPAGIKLGEERFHNGVYYRFMYNGGNSAINPGFIASPKSLGSGAVNVGPFSATVSTVSQTAHALGAVVNQHSTVPTGYYFWGAFRGYPVRGAANVRSFISGSKLAVGDDGGFCTMVTAATAAAIDPNAQVYCVGNVVGQYYSGIASTTTGLATLMTATASGDLFVSFPDFVF